MSSSEIDNRIRELGGWRGETLARMRALIHKAVPAVAEEWKWNNPVWSCNGILCTGEAYAKVVKLTFAHGASLPDPAGLFNSSLTGNTRRAIDIREGETVNARAFQALIRAAATRNSGPARKKITPLAGGNPQVAKAEGDAPVQKYIAAMPGWKREVGAQLDALITRKVPGVRKAIKWNSPFYGVEGQGWFASFHVFTRYVKLTFFRGASLTPALPGYTERTKTARWIDLHETDKLDEKQLAKWIQQAAKIPGWDGSSKS